MEEPLVSIIIPTYNRSSFLGETLESVCDQTYSNWECIVVDDGSTDWTDELMFFFTARDKRIKYFKRLKTSPKGANACRNYGFKLSSGLFIQWLDSDDLVSSEKIEQQVKVLIKTEVDIVYSSWVSFQENPGYFIEGGVMELYKECRTPKDLFDYFGNNREFFPPNVYLTRREQIIKAGGWNEHLHINQDAEFFSRVLLASNRIQYNSSGLAYYRRGAEDNNTSLFDSAEKVEDGILSWKLIEQAHKIRYKIETIPYVENGKKQSFYAIRKAGFLNLVYKHADFYARELAKWEKEEKKRSSLKRQLQRIKKFVEIRLFRM